MSWTGSFTVYAVGHAKLPWARTVAQPMGRDNGSHTTYLVSETMCTAPRISRTDNNELRLVP
jgi:hypothetical protein